LYPRKLTFSTLKIKQIFHIQDILSASVMISDVIEHKNRNGAGFVVLTAEAMWVVTPRPVKVQRRLGGTLQPPSTGAKRSQARKQQEAWRH
jgi:hypothetical protein